MQNPKSYGKYMTAGNTVKPTFYNILKEIYMYLDLSIISIRAQIFNEFIELKKEVSK